MAFISSVSIVGIGFIFHLRVQYLPFRIKRSSKWNSQITELAELAIPTNELLPCRKQMTFPLIQRKIERMLVFMLWVLTFVTTLAAKNGAFIHHGNILVTAKMVICVSVAKIKLHTAVIKYKIYFLSSRGNHDGDVIIAVIE